LSFVDILSKKRRLYLTNHFDELTETLKEEESKTIKSLNYEGDF
jgi:hypothetical protein